MIFAIPNTGKPGPTVKITCGDVAGSLSATFTSTVDRSPAIGALLTCETHDIRFTFGGNITTPTGAPTQGAAGTGHVLAAGQSLVLQDGAQVRTFQYINYTNGSNAILQVTPMFRGGVS